ncbi:MAG TPA: glycoside hydrolase family 15 protein [Bacteroidales bacterium]|nr:glycoside hydrolase family 15 protein [Bacteroidales bacterium]
MGNLDYGAIGNCRSAALVSAKGSIDWLCFPDFDSPSVFAKILDKEKGGSLSFEVEAGCKISQQYKAHTNILSTLFETEEWAFEVVDFMPRYKIEDFNDHFLPPELYRLLRVKRGVPQLKVCYDPKLNYASLDVVHKDGPKYIKSVAINDERETIYLYSDLDYTSILQKKSITLTNDSFLLVSYNQKLIPVDIKRVELEYQRTRVYWLNWANRSRKFTQYNDSIERSMLVLKLMSYQRTGAVLAALTTSIPETIGEVRNWDYRFCWMRDASMSIKTLLSLGHRGAAKRFMDYIHSILKSKGDRFQIMYGIRGERELIEFQLEYLSGFQNSRPVRIGNAAYSQKQSDSVGYLMDVIYQYYLYFPGTLDEIEDMWEVVKNIVKTVYEDWKLPDNGIWEIRGKSSHFVLSKVMCWVALDRAVRIAELLNETGYAEKWRKEADRIRIDVHQKGWKDSIQSFSQTYENEDLDASLLLMEGYGFIDATDERYIKTVAAIQKDLRRNGLLYRYINHDDFGLPSSAFTICTFWMIRALFVTGNTQEARALFDTMLSYANHVGLFSEDLDFETKAQLGNFPQAYSHLALIETAQLFSEEKAISRFIKP